MQLKVIAIVGPTSSGKTALGIWLAKKIGGEIISADSRQVYRGLNLGTGKVTKKEMAGVPHHLLDVASPKKQFSADDFVKQAKRCIDVMIHQNKIPIVVGGTGFYVDALVGRIALPNVPPNPALRTSLNNQTIAELLRMLKTLDPARAATVEPHHKRRLIRAIEIAKAIGKSPPSKSGALCNYEVLWIGLNPPPRILQKKIRERLYARLRAGMVAEAKRLHAQGLSYKRMRELGLEYRSLAKLLQGHISRPEMEAELERAIGHYAKRQMRWFKRNKDILWVSNKAQALQLAKKFVSR